MSRCELSGKGPVVTNMVSHSKRRTKSRRQPNIQKKQLFSETLGKLVCLKVAVSTIKDLEHMGGFDAYVLNQDNEILSKRALTIKRRIKQRLGQTEAAKKA